jgi:hypothetical protein
MFENRVLRIIFGPKMEELARDWRRLRNEKLHKLYTSPYYLGDQVKDEMGRACSTLGETRNVYNILVEKI